MSHDYVIAADSSSMIALFTNQAGRDVELILNAMNADNLALPAIVLSELMSDVKIDPEIEKRIKEIPLLQITEGFWERAGKNRAKLLSKKLKARLADVLIAQACIDNNVMLIARDADYRHFAKHCGLKLAC